MVHMGHWVNVSLVSGLCWDLMWMHSRAILLWMSLWWVPGTANIPVAVMLLVCNRTQAYLRIPYQPEMIYAVDLMSF